MLKKIILAMLVVLVGFIGFVAIQPADYRVERSASISAPPSVVFDQINDFHKWDAWSPWADIDPQMKTSFEGASVGEGSVYKWTGNNKVGEGSMKIVESRPGERVGIALTFVKPFAGTSDTTFTFLPAPNGTSVKWSMSGKNNFIGKAMCVFMNMDKMMGPIFEKGLASLGKAAEEAGKANKASAVPVS